jgi:hypothetical protein
MEVMFSKFRERLISDPTALACQPEEPQVPTGTSAGITPAATMAA